MSHDWKRLPGNTSVWRCMKCNRYTRVTAQNLLPTDECEKTGTEQFIDPDKEVFEELVEKAGKICIVYKIRRHVMGCWDFSYDDRGVILIDGNYKAIGSYRFGEILDWLN